jgi:hypothetical protein
MECTPKLLWGVLPNAPPRKQDQQVGQLIDLDPQVHNIFGSFNLWFKPSTVISLYFQLTLRILRDLKGTF